MKRCVSILLTIMIMVSLCSACGQRSSSTEVRQSDASYDSKKDPENDLNAVTSEIESAAEPLRDESETVNETIAETASQENPEPNINEQDYNDSAGSEKTIESTVIDSTEESKPSGSSNTDFRAMMDSYEEFFDSYVDFMQNYGESGNSMSMLSDYLEFMKKYAEMMESLEAVNTEDLSSEDYKYYLDVLNRINKRLLDITES